MDKELITAQFLAGELNLSVETVWRYTREKKIPYIELGSKQYRYRLADVVGALSGSAVAEKSTTYYHDQKRKLTYQDYLELPEESGYRHEIFDGILVKEPSPNVMHQRVLRSLFRVLDDYFGEACPNGEVFFAPLDVTFDDVSVVQPDLFYISENKKSIVHENRVDGPPDLVVEILSPSNSRKDRLQKMQIYKKAGVEHYWLVDPQEKTMECYALNDGLYTRVTAGMDNEVVELPHFPGLSIPLRTIWNHPKSATGDGS
jgi:Uma2 family endonuclease